MKKKRMLPTEQAVPNRIMSGTLVIHTLAMLPEENFVGVFCKVNRRLFDCGDEAPVLDKGCHWVLLGMEAVGDRDGVIIGDAVVS